jgi:hypothetical protein
MEFLELERYSSLYTKAKEAGAAKLLNESLGFRASQVVPLGISHGVDFHMCNEPMDIQTIEPIHWAYNKELFERAQLIKDTILLPHPWWFVTRGGKMGSGQKVLVIGPPPGSVNDQRLLSILEKKYEKKEITLLLKQRGDINKSKQFWLENEIDAITAGAQDEDFYIRLHGIISSHSEVVCCTFSSAAFFAASIGKKVSFLKEYKYLAYEVANYQSIVNYNSLLAKDIVSRFVKNDKEDVTALAQNILGFTSDSIEDIKIRYIEKVRDIKTPTFKKSVLSLLMREAALLAKKPSLAVVTPKKIATKGLFRPRVIEFETNEISVWLDGQNPENLKIKETFYIKGKTEPGCSFDRGRLDREIK